MELFHVFGELEGNEEAESGISRRRENFDTGERTLADIHGIGAGAEEVLDELGEIRLVADDHDVFEIGEPAQFGEGSFRIHAASEP